MEIAPVAGVRAVSLLRQPKAADASQPFRIDASERTEDDSYSPDGRHSSDALEEGNDVVPQEDGTGPAESTPAAAEGGTISIIV
jgi:hypothetical protein